MDVILMFLIRKKTIIILTFLFNYSDGIAIDFKTGLVTRHKN